jgi:uncharacterized protein
VTADREYVVMAKPIGPTCNLTCAYCYYLRKENLFTSEQPRRMPDELLEKYIAERLQNSPGPATSFEWHGGEPTLLGLDFFRRVVQLQRKHSPTGRRIINGLQTNGTLINEDWAAFLARAKFSVGLSLDGPADVHDAFRRTCDNRPTHGAVERAFRLLRRHKVHCDILCVVHAANVADPLRVYHYFKELGARYIQFLPLVEPVPGPTGGVSARTATPEALGTFFVTIFDEWIHGDLGRIVVQMFDEALRPFCKLPHALCIFSETCGTVPVLEHDGRLFCCDHYVDPDHCLGNLDKSTFGECTQNPALIAFGLRKRDGLPNYCKHCDVVEWCNGGCPKDRIATAADEDPDGEKGLNYFCPAFKRFFLHSRPMMQRLAIHWQAGKPLEQFVQGLRQENKPGLPDVGRNDPCPCGSGLKYKKCCALPAR